MYEKSSIRKLLKKEPNLCEPRLVGNSYFCCDLAHKNLGSIDGIENLNIKKSGFYHINLDNNNLRTIDLEYLLRTFPNLITLTASNNKIKKIILPKTALPKNLQHRPPQ